MLSGLTIYLDYLDMQRMHSATCVTFTRETLQPTLYAISQVSRALNGMASWRLYREICLSSSIAMDILVKTLEEHEELRCLVSSFHYYGKMFFFEVQQKFAYTSGDYLNEDHIHELCPNISHSRLHWTKLMTEGQEPSLWDPGMERLTLLRLWVPGGEFFAGRIMSSSVELPALQSLFLSCYGQDQPDQFAPNWFCMPQLRRLTLENFSFGKIHAILFPKDSPLISIIEILGGDCIVIDLFDPLTSPLLPYVKSLESLTITAKNMYDNQSMSHFRNLSLGFLEGLTELCVPYRSFMWANTTQSYPPRLTELVFLERLGDELARISRFYFLERLRKDREEQMNQCQIQRVRVLLLDAEEYSMATLYEESESELRVLKKRGYKHCYTYTKSESRSSRF
ncbi:hypothetical protein A7U60_g799 [Sanghuangporus baumii]|uniref:Uncharacterized protein n=1 Tax=Sanghuangporus baumii TaxID=108892 RepID=A0A9Q5I586_SANBA|nr:hypothetical protein A7U60_g799 [Sanghuangporus baumii]